MDGQGRKELTMLSTHLRMQSQVKIQYGKTSVNQNGSGDLGYRAHGNRDIASGRRGEQILLRNQPRVPFWVKSLWWSCGNNKVGHRIRYTQDTRDSGYWVHGNRGTASGRLGEQTLLNSLLGVQFQVTSLRWSAAKLRQNQNLSRDSGYMSFGILGSWYSRYCLWASKAVATNVQQSTAHAVFGKVIAWWSCSKNQNGSRDLKYMNTRELGQHHSR